MSNDSLKNAVVCVVGLGYVGLPLAESFSRHIRTIGFDIDREKTRQIIASGSLVNATNDPRLINDADYILICVPTPVTKNKLPDLSFVLSATSVVGKNMKKGAKVVLESTVYPGVTEEIVKPLLEKESGLTCGPDFRIGYSPERTNPGDDIHVLSKITKIVAGMDFDTLDDLDGLYSLVTTVYRAPSIQVAESAKIIENIQRDINIALMNEFSIIFHRLGIKTEEVIAAAATKWNFLPFSPGLVGGHCIPVNPYYLVARAKEVGYHPQVILSGRAINDSMPGFVAQMAIKGLNDVGKVIKGSKVLIMGLTYKENVPDIRTSPVEDMVKELKDFGIDVYGHDPLLEDSVIRHFGAKPLPGLDKKMDAVILSVAHDQFCKMTVEEIRKLMNKNPVLIDVRGMIDKDIAEKTGIYYQRL
jgi:UDPglucose 6-dehydrogenase/UDP-N-acetyl-D-galactosamine dehydrogenase